MMLSSRNMSTSQRIKFENPPISELVVALFYLPILELKAQHVGLYWDRIREKFSLCDQHPIIVNPNDPQPFIEAPGEFFPLPRFWFHSEKQPTLIQIQRNAFLLNWRRVPGAGDYPHYESVIQDFWREFEGYAHFIRDVVGGRIDVVQRCELSYINLLEANELFASPTSVSDILPSLSGLAALTSPGARELAGVNATFAHRVNANLFIDTVIRVGLRSDTSGLGLSFELKAHGSPPDLSLASARDWYESAHDATYKLFLDATSKQAQETLWKPR
jgi:uncharacterized protein (TIGR04255 family)